MHKLKCIVQNYDWGQFSKDSMVAKIFEHNGGKINPEKTYAEYWMGTHINGPSFIEETQLDEFLKKKYNYTEGLPFLFKVLSIKDALSIQAHPDKEYAEYLHSVDKEHYKDDNHKPELAIAISENFKLFFGFLNIEEALRISEFLLNFTNQNVCKLNVALVNFTKGEIKKDSYLQLIMEIIKLNDDDVKNIMSNYSSSKISSEDMFIREKFDLMVGLHEKFKNDKGIIFSLFMNYYELKKGQALFIGPNIPHAYLEGTCIECMANSDNVIRLGLTPKFVDSDNFLNVKLFLI
jgi:mannose-6-phosphate isomerase